MTNALYRYWWIGSRRVDEFWVRAHVTLRAMCDIEMVIRSNVSAVSVVGCVCVMLSIVFSLVCECVFVSRTPGSRPVARLPVPRTMLVSSALLLLSCDYVAAAARSSVSPIPSRLLLCCV